MRILLILAALVAAVYFINDMNGPGGFKLSGSGSGSGGFSNYSSAPSGAASGAASAAGKIMK